eukprot:12691244-Prorocentrum_lima.AAC.1
MTSSLVGSEMCIRDSMKRRGGGASLTGIDILTRVGNDNSETDTGYTVSYTHLTLPTICSV